MHERHSTRPAAPRLQRTRETGSDKWTFRWNNGLVVHTDPFMCADTERVLPVGAPQDAILNRLVHSPELVANKRVLDAFAGSGVLGLMALRLGAAQVDFQDPRARAHALHETNCKANGFPAARCRSLLAPIEAFECAEPYDVVLSMPPCVLVPAGIDRVATPNGGLDGNSCLEPLLSRLDAVLRPSGEAFLWIMQLVDGERPLIADAAVRGLPERTVEFAPVQTETMPLAYYVAACLRCFPANESRVRSWEADLQRRFSAALGIQHFLVHVQPKRTGPALWSVSQRLTEQFAEGLPWPGAANRDLALARVMELVVPAE